MLTECYADPGAPNRRATASDRPAMFRFRCIRSDQWVLSGDARELAVIHGAAQLDGSRTRVVVAHTVYCQSARVSVPRSILTLATRISEFGGSFTITDTTT